MDKLPLTAPEFPNNAWHMPSVLVELLGEIWIELVFCALMQEKAHEEAIKQV